VLDRLKNDLATRHIPVCVISTDDSRERALRSGALGFISKPIQGKDVLEQALDSLKAYTHRTVKSLLVVMPDCKAREKLLRQLEDAEVQITAVADGPHALQILRERQIDCIVLDEEVPDIAPAMVAEAIPQAAAANQMASQMPVILYHHGDAANDSYWHHCKETFTVREVRSLDRLLDQVAFFLHRDIARLPEDKRLALEDLYQSKKVLAGKKVLIVDDDIRNIFALATVLDEQGMVVLSADNGREAIRILQADPSIHIVLMDIMMPEMDGIVTIQEIRKIPSCRDLPIIAVTAKAMKGDRERCIEAGAWDYLAKPVDTLHLLSVLSAWLQC
jgi:CheY-like chemotaxis protein